MGYRLCVYGQIQTDQRTGSLTVWNIPCRLDRLASKSWEPACLHLLELKDKSVPPGLT